MARWWETQPVRFECQKGCITCCAKPGWVYFDKEDVANASGFLKLRADEFKHRFGLRLEAPGRWEMEVADGQPCPFLNSNGCGIHSAKPKQCRAFPFWHENLSTRKAWKEVAKDCPGIGQGQPVSREAIHRFLELPW